MRLKCLSGNRELILRVMEREIRAEAVYRPLPFFSYTVGDLTLTRDGFLVLGNDEEGVSGVRLRENKSPKKGRKEIKALRSLAELGLCETVPYPEESDVVTEAADSRRFIYPVIEDGGRTLLNLMCIISARQLLINRSLDMPGALFIRKALMKRLLAHPPESANDFLRSIYNRDKEYRGVIFSPGSVEFTCFRKARPEEAAIHRQMADLIMNDAETKKWVKPFTRRAANKRDAYRTWINSIGMIGTEYEEARRVMLARLPGEASDRGTENNSAEVCDG